MRWFFFRCCRSGSSVKVQDVSGTGLGPDAGLEARQGSKEGLRTASWTDAQNRQAPVPVLSAALLHAAETQLLMQGPMRSCSKDKIWSPPEQVQLPPSVCVFPQKNEKRDSSKSHGHGK